MLVCVCVKQLCSLFAVCFVAINRFLVLLCFESSVLPPYGNYSSTDTESEEAVSSTDIPQGTQLKAMRFSANNIVLQTSGLNTCILCLDF